MGMLGLDQNKKIVKCDAASYYELKDQAMALLSGLSLGQYLSTAINLDEEEDNTVKEES
jgi:hypothetical protein